MINTKKQAFTLVELIVVITILAILGTIAFISLQGYSQDAKNSKVTSDIASLAQKVTIRTTDVANATTLPDLVNTWATNEIAAWNRSFNSGSTNISYWVGNINFTELQESGDKFKDPEGKDYIAAYAIDWKFVTFQIAWQIKDSAWIYTAKINWNYYQVNTTIDNGWLIADATNAASSTWTLDNQTLSTTGLY